MAVLSYREVLPRTFSHKFGESPTAEMKFVCTLDGPTPTQTIISTVGYSHGRPHPEYDYLLMLDGSVNETDQYHAEVTLTFRTPQANNYEADPLQRPDVWSFSTSGLSVPTFRYYEGSGNGNIKPLTNAAKEIIQGAQAIEGELRASVSGNRAEFPLATAIAVTGCVNSDSYAGALPHQWLCNGISAQQTTEVVDEVAIAYWQVTAELSYKPSGYKLYLPNAGFNYLDGGVLKRASVKFRNEDGTDVDIASSSVVALNANGGLLAAGQEPLILDRRVNAEVAFQTYFGNPPTT